MAVGCYWDLESDDGLTIVSGKLCVCSGVILPILPLGLGAELSLTPN